MPVLATGKRKAKLPITQKKKEKKIHQGAINKPSSLLER